MIGSLAGCATPAGRVRNHAAAFGRLSPADQRLVLRGRVRPGLGQEAVVIAWGHPDDRYEAASPGGSKEKTSREVWVYRRQLTTYAPIGSYDQWPPGSRRVPLGVGLLESPGFGFGGSGYEGWLLYHPRVVYTESYIRRAVFVDGALKSYQQIYGESPPLP